MTTDNSDFWSAVRDVLGPLSIFEDRDLERLCTGDGQGMAHGRTLTTSPQSYGHGDGAPYTKGGPSDGHGWGQAWGYTYAKGFGEGEGIAFSYTNEGGWGEGSGYASCRGTASGTGGGLPPGGPQR